MDKLINMTGPTRSTYYDQVDQIEHKQVKMIRKRKANRMVRVLLVDWLGSDLTCARGYAIYGICGSDPPRSVWSGQKKFPIVTLISIPIRSTGLMSKREDNYNVMICRSQVVRDLSTSSFCPKILHASIPSSLPPLWALLFTTLLLLQPHLPCINSATSQY